MIRTLLLLLTVVSLVDNFKHHKQCGTNEEFNYCGNMRPVRCGSNEPQECITSCESGCFCKEGFIRAETGDKCIPTSDCPHAHEQQSKSCCPSLQHLTDAGMAKTDDRTKNTVTAGKTVSVGVAKFVPKDEGFVVTCQCSGPGDTCYLEFFDIDPSLNTTRMWNTIDVDTEKSNGIYPLLTSPLLTCDDNGTNLIEGVAVTHFDCVAYRHQFCPLEMEEETDLDVLTSMSGKVAFATGMTEALQLNDSFRITCQCPEDIGTVCLLYIIDKNGNIHNMNGNVTKSRDGTYPVISFDQFSCNNKGATVFQDDNDIFMAEKFACVAENSATLQQFVLLNMLLLLLISFLV